MAKLKVPEWVKLLLKEKELLEMRLAVLEQALSEAEDRIKALEQRLSTGY